MGHLYELYIPELEEIVKFRILSLEEGQIFCLDHDGVSPSEYKKAVLNQAVYNLKTEIAGKLRDMPKRKGEAVIDMLYNAAIMLNPGMNFATWLNLTRINFQSGELEVEKPEKSRKPSSRRHPAAKERVSRTKFLNLERHLKEKIIGQNDAVEEVVSALKRAHVGLQDPTRPLGVFLFAGASGIGKTLLARELHKYLFDDKYDLVRIDCGEYQQKHENQKLIGAPPGYVGHDEGGQLTNQIFNNPDTVLLIDEIEKAHPDLLNTFLRIFDEGMVTDGQGRRISFRSAIIILTTNLGNDKIVNQMIGRRTGFNQPLYIDVNSSILPDRSSIIHQTDAEIRKSFKPELLNRIDKTVVFNHLTNEDYEKIADLELQAIQEKLDSRGYELSWDADVVTQMVGLGVNPVEGARRLSRIRRTEVEDKLADVLLVRNHPKGTIFQIVSSDKGFTIKALAPPKQLKAVEEECS